MFQEDSTRMDNSINHDNNKPQVAAVPPVNILDQALRGDLPIIRSHQLENVQFPNIPNLEFLHAHWSHPAVRDYGIGPDNVIPADGGVTVKGEWPDLVTNMTYIPILKNAHTTVCNAFGDLRQRLHGGVVDGFYSTAKTHVKHRSRILNTSSVLFTILRDPVDRFISATCEDLRLSRLTKLEAWGCNNNADFVNCVVEKGTASLLMQHQKPQASQLKSILQDVNQPVAVIHFDQLGELLVAIGNKPEQRKVRDRSDISYYAEHVLRQPMPKNATNVAAGSVWKKEGFRSASAAVALDTTKLNATMTRKLQEIASDLSGKGNADAVLEEVEGGGYQEIEAKLEADETAGIDKKILSGKVLAAEPADAVLENAKERGALATSSKGTTGLSPNEISADALANQREVEIAKRMVEKAEKEQLLELLPQFCGLKGHEMEARHRKTICAKYKEDIELFKSVGFPVHSCDGMDDS